MTAADVTLCHPRPPIGPDKAFLYGVFFGFALCFATLYFP